MSEPHELSTDPETCRRALAALEGVEAWYREQEAATTEEELFDSGRALYHAMKPVLATLRRARGLAPEQPCTDCGVEEGGTESGLEADGITRYSLCAGCSRARHPDWFEDEPTDAEEPEVAHAVEDLVTALELADRDVDDRDDVESTLLAWAAQLPQLTDGQLGSALATVEATLEDLSARESTLLVQRVRLITERNRRLDGTDGQVVPFRRAH